MLTMHTLPSTSDIRLNERNERPEMRNLGESGPPTLESGEGGVEKVCLRGWITRPLPVDGCV